MHYQTLADALAASAQGRLRDWVIAYLRHEGGNPGLARHLRERPDAFVFLAEHPLGDLKRQTGPEEGMIWRKDRDAWERGIAGFLRRMEHGVMPLPIVATDFWDDLHIADGSHRHEALRRAGIARYWVIFALQHRANRERILASLQ
jgi:hypothetical protein